MRPRVLPHGPQVEGQAAGGGTGVCASVAYVQEAHTRESVSMSTRQSATGNVLSAHAARVDVLG
jgi:hypothetical protein